ncbi:ATP-dependent helicase [Helicobacter suis]|uniref:ATP-dependent helicase n=1 Tax=Helicobacter suis TaxID=104628 RepID=UPI0013D19398|nr:ATP-dependent helicase [Helicobacter suis]
MNKIEILQGLNPAQKRAVEHVQGPLLVLAGAGSGKTKTLTTRLAYLIGYVGIPPENTLTLTFTNKAASEMHQRAMKLIGRCTHKPTLCTFHSFGLNFLKQHMERLDRGLDFELKTPREIFKLLKPALLAYKKDTRIDNDAIFLNYLMKRFSQIKNHLITPERCQDIWHAFMYYTEALEKENWVDFDDLIALPYRILDYDLELAHSISKRYQYISIDEYQDTNPLQLKLIKTFCCAHENLCAVGDDDQSIYGFRGADIENILNFPEYFPQTKIIKLEQNYRSTKEILTCANELIIHNKKRYQKTLISQKDQSSVQKLEAPHFINTTEENNFITKKILEAANRGVAYEDMAILYRFNCLSKEVEKGLLQAKIPYTVIGDTNFYERAIIKDRLAYLYALINCNADSDILRLLPKLKHIGKGSIDKIKNLCARKLCSIAKAYQAGLLKPILPQSAYTSLQDFFTLLFDLAKDARHIKNIEQARILFKSYLKICQQSPEELEKEWRVKVEEDPDFSDPYYLSRLEETFISCMEDSLELKGVASVQDFLEQIILETPIVDSKGVKCMSVHKAKGLEFSVVFVIGFEEDFFPYKNADDQEEERRLGYVAITRAKEELYLCSAQEREHFGTLQTGLAPSHFLKEAKLIQFLKIGDCVMHEVFGKGIIEALNENYIQVRFDSNTYWIMASMIKKA